jgi:hypothetical protein
VGFLHAQGHLFEPEVLAAAVLAGDEALVRELLRTCSHHVFAATEVPDGSLTLRASPIVLAASGPGAASLLQAMLDKVGRDVLGVY